MMPTRRAALAAGLAAPGLVAPGVVRAQGWPNGPVRLVVPFPPGGSVDTLARLVQQPLQQRLGVAVVVENRAGASGALGTGQVARGPADGQSWLLVFDTHAVNPALQPNMGFDTVRDLAPVLLVGTAPMLITTHKDRPFRSFAEVLAAARARPDTVTYGTIGNGSLAHLAMALLERAAGVRLVHVPYRGGGPLVVAATANEVDLPVATGSIFAPLVQAGTLRALASTGATRVGFAPDAPTLRESGVDVDAEAFWGVLTRAGTPAAVIDRMTAALRETLAEPAVRERLTGAMAIDLAPAGGAAFGMFLERQMALWGRVVRENGIRPD